MERLKIKAIRRENTGKEYAKKIRREGLVPGIIYKKGASLPLELKETDLIHLIHQAHSENIVLELEISSSGGEKKETKTAILKDISHDTLRDRIMHVDFQEISLEEVIKVKVPVEIKGEPIGVKRDGGALEHLLWEIEVECKAAEIPEKIEVDVSNMEIGDAIHLSDLELPPEVKPTGSKDVLVVHVTAPKVEAVEEVAAVEGEEEEVKEPEVIREKKKEQEEESEEE